MSDAPDPIEDAEACAAPPGNLCTDPGCWDADRCVVARSTPRESAWAEFRDGPDYTPTDRYPVRDAFDAGWSLSLVSVGSDGWAAYAAEQERHAEATARLERLRDGVAHLHDVYAAAPNEPRCCSDCAANDISVELRRLLADTADPLTATAERLAERHAATAYGRIPLARLKESNPARWRDMCECGHTVHECECDADA